VHIIRNIVEPNFWIITYVVVLLTICAISSLIVRKNAIIPVFFVQQKWTVIDAAVVLMIGQVAVLLLQKAASFLQDNFLMFTALHLFYGPIMLTVVWLFFHFRLRQPLTVMGISKCQWTGNICLGSKWIFALYLPLFLLLYLLPDQTVSEMIGRSLAEVKGSVNAIEENLSFWGLSISVLLLFLMLLFGNALEEIYYRGIFYSVLRKTFNAPIANLMSSALFMLSHGGASLGTFAAGCLFAYLYERSKSLVPSISAHIMKNLISYVFLGFVIRTNVDHRNIIIVGILILSICLVITWLLSYKIKLSNTSGSDLDLPKP
jgi:membrane protease YdiL (CAAX protease family)